jgi:hypothetical protein
MTRLDEVKKLQKIAGIVKENYSEESQDNMANEGLFGSLKRAFSSGPDKELSKANSTNNKNTVTYDGQEFTQDNIEYDDYNSGKPCPRVEGDKLIVAHPAWSN